MREVLSNVRESFWFIPGLALIIATLAGIALVEVDSRVQTSLSDSWPRLFGVGAEGARGMLTAIATAMATVAGVVFSVTIVALSLAASTYSPRVLRTFMHDRPTQAVFGVFVGVFAYCLVVLRTVRGDQQGDAFVPSLAVFGALVLAFVGVSVLVYFIHHIAVAIQVPTILKRIATETRAAIDRLFPDELGEDEKDDENVAAIAGGWHVLPARRTGYLVSVESDELLAFARERGAVLRMELGVGEFAIESQPLASMSSVQERDTDDDADALDALIAFGSERTIEQDAAFGIQQIVDIAVRALSPGVNDPSTAILCIDHLSGLFVRLARRRIPTANRMENGELRVIVPAPTFAGLTALAFEPLTRYARGKPEVLARLERAARLVESAAPPARRFVMRRHLNAVAAGQVAAS